MRVIKLALISLVVFFLIIAAMSRLIPAHVRISKAINIASADSVFYLINDTSQWPRWHPAFQGQNATAVLQQNNIIVTPILKTDSLVTMSWQQDNKTPVLNSWAVHRSANADSAALQWYMDFHLKWYQKFSSLVYDKTYGTMMEQGLQNIKRIAQSGAH